MKTCWVACGVARLFNGEYIPTFSRGIAVEFNGMVTVDPADGVGHPLIRNASPGFLAALEERGYIAWNEPKDSVWKEKVK